MATIDLLEETANYLLNHCFVLGCVEEQRAKYQIGRASGRERV